MSVCKCLSIACGHLSFSRYICRLKQQESEMAAYLHLDNLNQFAIIYGIIYCLWCCCAIVFFRILWCNHFIWWTNCDRSQSCVNAFVENAMPNRWYWKNFHCQETNDKLSSKSVFAGKKWKMLQCWVNFFVLMSEYIIKFRPFNKIALTP